MGNVLKTGKTYQYKGISFSDAYSSIDEIINCKRQGTATIIRKIYSSLENKVVDNALETIVVVCGKRTVEEDGETVVYDDYQKYLSPEAVASDKDEFNRAYQYWDDIVKTAGGYIASDWESDEV